MATTQFPRLGVGLLALSLLLGFAPSVQAQQQPSLKEPSLKGPQLPQSKFNADEYFAKQNEKMKATPATQEQTEALEDGWNFASIILHPVIWIAAGLMLLSGLTWIYVRLSATTSTAKLAESDPWIRARLTQFQAASQDNHGK